MREHSDDEVAVRCAVADILVALSNGRCPEDRMQAVRRLLEKAARIAQGELEIKGVEA